MSAPPSVVKKTKRAVVPGIGIRGISFSEHDSKSVASADQFSTPPIVEPTVGIPLDSAFEPSAKDETALREDESGRVEEVAQEVVGNEDVRSDVIVDEAPADNSDCRQLDSATVAAETNVTPEPEGCAQSEAPADSEMVASPATTTVQDKEQFTTQREDTTENVDALKFLLAERQELSSLSCSLSHTLMTRTTDLQSLLDSQTCLCDEEKFDEAQNLECEIALVRRQIFETQQELFRDLPEKLRDVDNRVGSLLLGVQEKRAEELQVSTIKLEQERSSFEEKKCELSEKLKVVLEVDELVRDREREVGKRQEDVRVKRDRIDSAILAESEAVLAEKNRAEAEYEELDQLVQELQAKLKSAMEQRSACAMIVSASEFKLRTVRNEFALELDAIADEQAIVDELAVKLLREKQELGGGDRLQVQADLDVLQKEFTARAEELEESIKFAQREKDEVVHVLAVLSQWKEEDLKTEGEVERLRSELVEAGECTQFLAEAAEIADAEVDRFKASLSGMKAKLPLLEEEKKMAVANRSFKEAKDIASEMNEIAQKVAAADETIAGLKVKAKEARKHLNAGLELERVIAAKLAEAEAQSEEGEGIARRSRERRKMLEEMLEEAVLEEVRVVLAGEMEKYSSIGEKEVDEEGRSE